MQILPPRRPGNLGAFTAGPGAPGPTGQFKIQSGAAPSRQPSPQDLPAPKGSVAKPAPLSVSEQMEAQRKAAAQIAAKVVVPPGQADVYGRPAQVTVQSYAPPKHTPEVTQPPQQPNAQHAVSVQARQIPQTPQQVIQKTLAKDAGIATSLPPGQPPLRLPAPTPQVSKLTTRPEADKIQLKPLVSPPVSRESYAQSLATGAKVVGAKVAQQRAASAERQAASATKSFKRATDKAASAHTFAKDAAQQAKDAAEKAKALQVELSRIQKNQTASEDEKSKAEAAARSAQEEAARTAKAAADAKAKAEAASAEQAKLAAEAQRAVAVAEQTATVADEKIKDASVAQKAEAKIETAVADQPKMLPPPSGAPAVSGEAPAAAPVEKLTEALRDGVEAVRWMLNRISPSAIALMPEVKKAYAGGTRWRDALNDIQRGAKSAGSLVPMFSDFADLTAAAQTKMPAENSDDAALLGKITDTMRNKVIPAATALAGSEKPTVITGERQAATAAPEGVLTEKPASGSKVMPLLVLGGLAVLAYAAMRKKGSSLSAAPTLIEDLD